VNFWPLMGSVALNSGNALPTTGPASAVEAVINMKRDFRPWRRQQATSSRNGRGAKPEYNRWRDVCDTGLNLLFPPRCPLCETTVASDGLLPSFCAACAGKLMASPTALCRRCGGSIPIGAISSLACAQCRDLNFHFERAIPIGPYQHELRDVVVRMKEPSADAVAAACGRLMAVRIREVLGDELPDVLVFAPMHWRRRLQRRVNNAERLAQASGLELQLPVLRRIVRCQRHTQKQSLLSADQRRKNVRGAFGISKRSSLAGIHVGLVDDTLTTGATADEIARVLHGSGARQVTVLLAARGVSN
jgi:ComF family protein